MPRVLSICGLALGVAACAVPLRSGDNTPNVDAALDGRLVRCSALGVQAQDDADCISAFAEARRRILPEPAEK